MNGLGLGLQPAAEAAGAGLVRATAVGAAGLAATAGSLRDLRGSIFWQLLSSPIT
jgi:hypothetical protein